jgi:hypothetical protein
MTNTFQMKLNSIQPSQLYISSAKLDSVKKRLEHSKLVRIEPVPIKKLGGQVVLVDGHTRAFAAFLLGFSEIPVYWEEEELDWDEYEICVAWCKEEGIHTIASLKERVISPMDYQVLWLDRCTGMQKEQEQRRKAQKNLANKVTYSNKRKNSMKNL